MKTDIGPANRLAYQAGFGLQEQHNIKAALLPSTDLYAQLVC